jgi:hypothetical protein
MTPNDTCGRDLISSPDKAKLDNLSSQLANIASQIKTKLNEMYNTNIDINTDMTEGASQINSDFKMYYKIKQNMNKILSKQLTKTDIQNIAKIKKKTMLEPMLNMNDLNSMLTDTDLGFLQYNYLYLLWSIIAMGVIIVTINTIKK